MKRVMSFLMTLIIGGALIGCGDDQAGDEPTTGVENGAVGTGTDAVDNDEAEPAGTEADETGEVVERPATELPNE